ncbi:MAG TPA: hypothetical protein VGR37_03135 [Longimicrobiaceae bacterium]|nr:hypothetical protein [Longimicrobiaceae bacterium]
MYLPEYRDQEERFRELQAELQELKERILARVEMAWRNPSQDARERAGRRPRTRWMRRTPARPPLR